MVNMKKTWKSEQIQQLIETGENIEQFKKFLENVNQDFLNNNSSNNSARLFAHKEESYFQRLGKISVTTLVCRKMVSVCLNNTLLLDTLNLYLKNFKEIIDVINTYDPSLLNETDDTQETPLIYLCKEIQSEHNSIESTEKLVKITEVFLEFSPNLLLVDKNNNDAGHYLTNLKHNVKCKALETFHSKFSDNKLFQEYSIDQRYSRPYCNIL